MDEKYLVVNAGSSSLKFTLYAMPSEKEIVNGSVEKIGKSDSYYTLKFNGKKIEKLQLIDDHTTAVKCMLNILLQNEFIKEIEEIKGVGNRILHGGEFYKESVVIDDNVMNNLNSLIKLGPTHIPAQIAGIMAIKKVLPNIDQVAVFDTTFHKTIPKENYLYAVPYSWYEENNVRKYGFHGISHEYITNIMKKRFNNENINLIICHVGSGVSLSCIKNGKSYDTSMGLTPLDGVIMGTRSGSIDNSIISYISNERNLSIEEIDNILNKKSGLLGIAGQNDFRDLEQQAGFGDERSKLAIKMLENSIIKFIAQYYFELEGKIDAIVFTAGIGENASSLREDIVMSLSNVMNVKLNKDINDNIARFKKYQSGVITTEDSAFEILVIPTNEEFMILKDTYNILKTKNKVQFQKKLKI